MQIQVRLSTGQDCAVAALVLAIIAIALLSTSNAYR
jgi:hypothetical protein